ncbi:MAG: hypothetical protein WA581_13495 [Candidatus Acidiferrales bacterium]
MRRTLWLCAAVLVFAASSVIRAQTQQQDQTSSQASQTTTAPAAAPQQDPLAEAARKAREQKKDAPKAAKVFTNDNLPTQSAVSTVGSSPADTSQETGDTSTSAPAAASDEKTWRDKFAELHHTLDQDQAELDVLQREVGVGMVQYYGGDPQKATQDQESQQPLGAAYEKKVSDIDAKKKQVEADKQAISDAEDDLRKSGGDPGWAR